MSSRVINELGISAAKVSIPWRIEIAEARNQLARLSDEGNRYV